MSETNSTSSTDDTTTSTSADSTTTTTTETSLLDQLKAKYPSQYYCTLDKPCAWYNMWVYSSISNLPDPSTLYAMTAAEWTAKGGDNGTSVMAVIDGKLQPYAPPAPAPTLTSRLADLDALCTTYLNAGVYYTPSSGTTSYLFDSGPASQTKMLTAFVSATNGLWPASGGVWKIANGSYVNMTATDVIDLAKRAQAYVQECYAHEAALHTALTNDLTTDITAGWPSNT